MVKTDYLEVGLLALIQQKPNGDIVQIGLTEQQSKVLQLFVATLCNHKLVVMPSEFNLVLKKEADNDNP